MTYSGWLNLGWLIIKIFVKIVRLKKSRAHTKKTHTIPAAAQRSRVPSLPGLLLLLFGIIKSSGSQSEVGMQFSAEIECLLLVGFWELINTGMTAVLYDPGIGGN